MTPLHLKRRELARLERNLQDVHLRSGVNPNGYLVSRCGVRLLDTQQNRQVITGNYGRVTCDGCKILKVRVAREATTIQERKTE